MAFPGHVSAFQVGSYFVGQYYQVLQQQPDFVHQFYTDASTMIRIDGNISESASAMLQIHALIMSLNFTGIEIKTAHSLESWNGGVLVMVSGSVQSKNFSGRRKFMQTFFLAPQEKGYFVLNDIFHFIEEEQIHQNPETMLAQNDIDSKINASGPILEPELSDYVLTRDIQANDYVTSTHAEENDLVDKYSLQEQQQQVPEVEVVEETPTEESAASFQNSINPVRDPSPGPVEEPVGEPPKQTYASILRVARGQSASSVAPQPSFNKIATPTSEWHHASQQTNQQSYPASSAVPERSVAQASEEFQSLDEEGESKSVYVRNLPSTVLASDIEQEFENFGRIKLDGVVIRNRKEIGVCYAFVEFEDVLGVQNAIKASPIQFAGRQVHIEERRPNNSSTSRGGRGRGRGRGSYQTEASRGRFGSRNYGRGSGQDGGDREFNRPRGNGFYHRAPRQDRGVLGNQVSRNGQNLSEAMD